MEGRWRGDGGEMEGRRRGDGGETEGRWRGDGGETEGRWRGDQGGAEGGSMRMAAARTCSHEVEKEASETLGSTE